MIDPVQTRIWQFRLGFVALAGLLLFFKLLPFGSLAGGWPGPDLLLCLIFVWIVRRPDYLPVWLVAAVMLFDDLMVQRPPGLWAALVVLASEFLRSRTALAREMSFWVEWLFVAGLVFALLAAYRLIFAMAFLPQPALGFALLQSLWSILCYPVLVGLSRLALNLRKPATGEVDSYGRRL